MILLGNVRQMVLRFVYFHMNLPDESIYTSSLHVIYQHLCLLLFVRFHLLRRPGESYPLSLFPVKVAPLRSRDLRVA